MMNDTISSKVAYCLEQFENVLSSGHLESREVEVPVSVWKDELGRLRVWVGNVGAHGTNQSSLEYRLRDASHIKGQIIRQLGRLQRVLEDLQLFLKEPFPGEASGTESDECEGEEAAKGVRFIYSNLVDSISGLNQMSVLTRNPAPYDRLIGIEDEDAIPFEFHDRQHVSKRYPLADSAIVNWLGSAISRRRALLKYRARSHKQVIQNQASGLK